MNQFPIWTSGGTTIWIETAGIFLRARALDKASSQAGKEIMVVFEHWRNSFTSNWKRMFSFLPDTLCVTSSNTKLSDPLPCNQGASMKGQQSGHTGLYIP